MCYLCMLQLTIGRKKNKEKTKCKSIDYSVRMHVTVLNSAHNYKLQQ